jgi:hypothetical protein
MESTQALFSFLDDEVLNPRASIGADVASVGADAASVGADAASVGADVASVGADAAPVGAEQWMSKDCLGESSENVYEDVEVARINQAMMVKVAEDVVKVTEDEVKVTEDVDRPAHVESAENDDIVTEGGEMDKETCVDAGFGGEGGMEEKGGKGESSPGRQVTRDHDSEAMEHHVSESVAISHGLSVSESEAIRHGVSDSEHQALECMELVRVLGDVAQSKVRTVRMDIQACIHTGVCLCVCM